MQDFYDELEFPPKAEYLAEYKNYQVDIAHWRELSAQFQRTFRQVYARRSAAVLLVYGPLGSGKSLFSRRLAEDYERTVKGAHSPDMGDNLWHVLVAPDEPDEEKIKAVTSETSLTQLDEENNALANLRIVAKKDTKARVRIYVLDDAQRDTMVRSWTDLSATDFYSARQTSADALLAHVAERINAACRKEFQRSIFVMLSNDRSWLSALHGHLDRWYKGLATLLDLPVPPPDVLERIVRVNTNRLNRVSYWYCLDAAKMDKRRDVRRVLLEQGGFTDSFDAVSESLGSDSRRPGRPGNRNVLTLVTLGVEVAVVQEFLGARETLKPDKFHVGAPRHIGVWEVAGPWASGIIKSRPEPDFLRRARMLESEFMFRWVSLDMVATHALLEPPAPNDLGGRLLELIQRRPSIGEHEKTKQTWRDTCEHLESELDALQGSIDADTITKLVEEFQRLGQRRSTLYEPAIKRRVAGPYGAGFAVYTALKPDLIVRATDKDAEYGEYKICSLTGTASDGDEDLTKAILRTGHSVEFTAFLREKLEGLEPYLVDKIKVYATLLESV